MRIDMLKQGERNVERIGLTYGRVRLHHMNKSGLNLWE
jgi:hypothetical protein